MPNVVILPVHKRDDFLQVTLDCLKNADKAEEHIYLFCIDRGFDYAVKQVAESFPFQKEIIVRPNHRFHGNSLNVLEGYRDAMNLASKYGSNLIYLVEEDIWVGKDFFTFHETVQSNFNNFCVSAVWCHMDNKDFPSEPQSIYERNHYQSLGVSWKPDKLSHVITHANPRYYRNMRHYVRAMAPQSKLGTTWSEQDGLINRILEMRNEKVIYPFVPRAFHAGFVGYNRRGQALNGSREERVAKLKSMTQEEMNDRAEVYKDIKKTDLEGHAITQFEMKNL